MQFGTENGTIYLAFLAVAAPLLGLYAAAMTIRRRRLLSNKLKRATIVAEYNIPLNLTPAEMGYMYEVKLTRRQIIATLLDLEHRQLVSIDKRLTVKLVSNDLSHLLPHEWMLTKLLGDRGPTALDDILTSENVREFEKRVRASLVTKGYLRSRSVVATLARGWLKMFAVLVIGLSVLFWAWTIIRMEPTSFVSYLLTPIETIIISIAFLPLTAMFAAILIVIHIYVSGQSGLGTEKLLIDWPKVEGFRAFVNQAGQGDLRYTSQELKAKTLARTEAYAVALGMHPQWQQRFKPAVPQLKIAEA